MSRIASTKMRQSSSIVSQFGSHEWLMKRELLPPLPPSMFRSGATSKTKVWFSASISSG
jgi:hypothetical protein